MLLEQYNFNSKNLFNLITEIMKDKKKLVGVRCQDCGHLSPEARPMCPECHGFNIEWHEFSGKATLVGRAGDDVLYGGAGNDYLLGGAGNDLAVGGAGYDVIKGQGGVDSLAGGEGQDRIVGESSEIDEEFAVLDDWADLMG